MIQTPNAKAIYDIYVCIFNSPFSLQKKNVVFSGLMAGEPWSWPVIGISRAALEALAAVDFRYKKGTICRAHLVDRIETARALFENSTSPLSRDHFFQQYLKTGSTIITLKSENRRGVRAPDYIPIDRNGDFFQNRLIFCAYGRKERDYLRELHSRFSKGLVILVAPPTAEPAV
ncbi:MAG: hypothetical protein HY924_00225 [Elusimicrobia bacterium]|nr:hypothetical protein [Elusimicrobiota bacterium]